MEKIIGIIAEYNPFHLGHLWQIEQIKKKFPDGKIVVVMSGHWTQRGEAAICDKWSRAKMAVLHGVDLVLELPVVYAARSAEFFARGAIKILKSLSVTHLAFSIEGKEGGEKNLLHADFSIDENRLHEMIARGKSYGQAYTELLCEKNSWQENFLRQPNFLLGCEYIKNLPKTIEPIILQRQGESYHSQNFAGKILSASGIRRVLLQNEFEKISHALPKAAQDFFCGKTPENLPDVNRLKPLIFYKIFAQGFSEKIYGLHQNEGLAQRILKIFQKMNFAEENFLGENFLSENFFEAFTKNLSSKRYSQARMKRTILFALLNVLADDIKNFDEKNLFYVRPLAFDCAGKKLLHEWQREKNFPIVTKINAFLQKQDEIAKMLSYEILATNLFALCHDEKFFKKYFNQDFFQSPIFCEK